MQHLTGHGSLPTCGTCRQSQLASFPQAGGSSRNLCAAALDYTFVVSAVSTTKGSGAAAGGGDCVPFLFHDVTSLHPLHFIEMIFPLYIIATKKGQLLNGQNTVYNMWKFK